MNMLLYLFKVNLAVVLFWALFRLAFKNLSFFQWNRFYLLGSLVSAFILPLLRLPLPGLSWVAAGGNLPELRGIDWSYMDHLTGVPSVLTRQSGLGSPATLLLVIYLVVAAGLLARSILRSRKLLRGAAGSRRIHLGKVGVYVQDGQAGSFTLFRRIYLDRYAWENRLRAVLRHEMVHAVQLHSLDLLFMELVTVLLWFNPFVFIVSGYVRDNHEYLADHFAQTRKGSLREYLECLRQEAIRYFSPQPASFFKRSNIKKRITMLTTNHLDRRKKWRYLGILPVASILLLVFHTPAESGHAESLLHPGEVWNRSLHLVPLREAPSQFPLPEKYRDHITWGYNMEAIHPITRKQTVHQGIDVAAPTGTSVFASAGGVVKLAENESGWGNLVILEHGDGYTTFYAHLDEITVKAGSGVSKGEVIGRVGNTGQSTGSHLHYEVRKNGEHLDPANFY
jgi:hypothetical protein